MAVTDVVIALAVAIASVIAGILLTRRGRNGWTALLGVILVVLGVTAFLNRQPYGWFAYAPLSTNVFVSAPLGSLAVSGLIVGAAGFFCFGCGVTGALTSKRRRSN